jgi:hypothetical protein
MELDALDDDEAARDASDACLLECLEDELRDDVTVPTPTRHEVNVGCFAIHKVRHE